MSDDGDFEELLEFFSSRAIHSYNSPIILSILDITNNAFGSVMPSMSISSVRSHFIADFPKSR